MKLSPQSQAVVARLLEGLAVKKGKVTVGPLNETARSLLKVIVKHFDEFSRLRGDDRASKLRDRFIGDAEAASQEASAVPHAAPPRLVDAEPPPSWKILRLRSQSIRGIAPPGESFEFGFHGYSNLIYGPNGSGKSSLLGAVIWVLTGEAIVDAAEPIDEAPLYKPIDGSAAGTKLRDWPIIATLPSGADVTKAEVHCSAELLLSRATNDTKLHLRRTHGSPLQASRDGSTWDTVADLGQIGVDPLDVQLSVMAPTVFGRRSIEEAEHTRNILGLMLGFDELEQLGNLASQMSGNRTRLAKQEEAAIEKRVTALRESLRLLAGLLPEATDSASALSALAEAESVTISDIDIATKSVEDAAKGAEKHLARVVGLSLQDGNTSGNLADRLTVAVDQLEKGFAENFASLQALSPDVALVTEDGRSPAARLAELEAAFHASVENAKAAVRSRHEWWKQETAPGSKAALLLKAAEHFQPTVADCPVCERRIDDVELVRRLTELKALDSHLGSEVRTFFGDLIDEHRQLVPTSISDLAALSIEQRLSNDWQIIRDELLGASFETLTVAYDSRIAAAIAAPDESSVPSLLPEECDPRFRALADQFVDVVNRSARAIAMLRWADPNFQTLSQNLDNLVTGAANESLLAQLKKGKHAALLVKPLVSVAGELAKSKRALQEVDNSRALVNVLLTLEAPLNDLKLLSKYAETAVREEFDSIKDATTEYLRLMYPESPTGMKPGKLKLGTGRDKSVEALLTGAAFEVPGQYFANASLQRAVALAFYFALLKKHPGGLGFIVMDDPILSLDEEHRERWSFHVLRPMLSTHQVLVATHQRQFIRHCANDFADDRIVELNPRDRYRRISWKPGDRLRRAEQQMAQGDHLSAATTMRKFREDVLISLDAYSPTPFFNLNDLAKSATDYEKSGLFRF